MKLYYPQTFPKDKEQFLKDLLDVIIKKNPKNRKELSSIIRLSLKDTKTNSYFPSLWQLLFVYYRFYKKSDVSLALFTLLRSVKTRSLSGIVPLSIFTEPKNSCPYHCVYCTIQDNAPKSYFADEAALVRAIRNEYDAFRQTKDRLLQFILSGHPIDKIDAIIQGGTFSFYGKEYREEFVKRMYNAANSNIENLIINGLYTEQNSKTIDEAKKINETAENRIVGLTIETRPDFINKEELLFLRKLGVTRVEIGVQSTDNNVLRIIKRGHTVDNVIQATKLLKEAGMKVTYHLMPGLPGSNIEKDYEVLNNIFTNNDFKPDSIKFYPTQIVWNTELLTWFKEKKYIPMQTKELIKLVVKFKKNIVPRWVRIHRLVRDLTKNDVAVKTFPSNFRQELQKELHKNNVRCLCIRCREIKDQKIHGKIQIKITKYEASSGIEYFIEAVDENESIMGFLRLRIPEYFL
ncbi:MAG: tRNA uridine(34) 5-carboxymethylaminomethyl modification radical SAM/GNAT enzyme Elp3, partial [bacterium]|nr:tRNA uridine(34) 5-carboxymethylaminomethyl modification radical SAM/GNAT enzyme Elp3 [bacterium]